MKCKMANCKNDAELNVSCYDICKECAMKFVDETTRRNGPNYEFMDAK